MATGTQFDVKNFISSLSCPFGLDPLREAVNLFPCCHKVNEIAAEKYYGKIVDGFCELREKQCVVCNTPVVAYAPDHTIREIVSQIFGHEQDLASLPTHPLVLEEKKAEGNLPYPGLPAIFVWTEGNWEPFNYGPELCRMIEFKSVTENSLLESFTLLGYWGGDIAIAVKFKDKFFNQYLLAHQLPNASSLDLLFKTSTPTGIKTLFRIIALHNEIPVEHFNQIREIVERGSCDPLPRPQQRSIFGLHSTLFGGEQDGLYM